MDFFNILLDSNRRGDVRLDVDPSAPVRYAAQRYPPGQGGLIKA